MSNSPKNPILNLFKINLLKERKEALSLQARFAKWLLTFGRFLVIGIELLVISAFVYRYQLDAKLAELDNNIRLQSDYLKSLQSKEKEIRQVQFQLENIKTLRAANPGFPEVIKTLSQITPTSIVLTGINYGKTADSASMINIVGQSPTATELAAYLKALQNNEAFEGVTLTNLSMEESVSFTITGILPIKGRGES